MLNRLSIKNYTLIESLEMNLNRNLNMITGETGAGKSIMLGAVGLLLGKRIDSKVFFNASEKCIIEGNFDISKYSLDSFFFKEKLDYESETSIRREITPLGKSKSFINDKLVTLEVLRNLGQYLMDVHSQHETLQLGSSDFQMNLVDIFSGIKHQTKGYLEYYNDYKEKESYYNRLLIDGSTHKKESDYNTFLLDELLALELKEGEQETLEKECELLENAQEIKQRLNELLNRLTNNEVGVLENLQSVKVLMKQLVGYSTYYQPIDKRFEEVLIEIKELTRDVELEEEKVDTNFEKMEVIQQRLSSIYELQKKHKVNSVKELLTIQYDLEEKNLTVDNLDETLSTAKAEAKAAERKVFEIAQRLSSQRLENIMPFSHAIKTLLVSLGMKDATITIQPATKPLGPTGFDELTILFSANKGLPPQPLKQVASGGEFSRLMFCVKYLLADKMAMPTIFFDEIDAGISGEIALKMGAMMRIMARKHQIIAISHLPQIAAKGDSHFFVYKKTAANKAVSSIRELTSRQSTEAIAKMIGGDTPSVSAFKSARELMNF